MIRSEILFPETGLDFRDKAVWAMANALAIAEQLGCEPTSEFEDCLKIFIDNDVRKAKVTDFLDVIFSNILTRQGLREAA